MNRWFATRLAFAALTCAITIACAPADAPVAVVESGKIVEVRNCPPLDPKYKVDCLLLTCEKTLFDRGTIPVGARIVKTRSDYKISDQPERSQHTVKFPEQEKFRYAMCEMEGTSVTSVRELSAREQSW
jgi:hypothetical protein